jgi:Domain of unknown function (DUF929)
VGRETNKNRRQKLASSAREKAAQARAEQKRAEQRARAQKVIGVVVVVALVVVAGVVYGVTRPTKNDPSGNRVSASSTILNQAGSVSDATLTKIGKGINGATLPTKVTGEPALTSAGKPELLYIGAEFCPYCAVERWSLYEALSKFGSFTSGVGEVRSAADDGNYASLDFYNAKYTSKYLTFTPVENEDRSEVTLQHLTAAQNALWDKLEPDASKRGFPFIDFGNVVATLGAPLDPTPLGSLDQAAIAKQLNDPSSKIAQTIGGGANEDIAAICAMTNNQPSSVCSSSTITGIQSGFSA